MKITLLSIITLFIGSIANAQDSAEVLFIGNSYTYANDLPTMLESIANSFGDVLIKDSQTPGGMTFSGHAASTQTYTKINSNDWDYVVLQAQSQEPSFPDGQVDTQTLPYAVQMADSVYANNYCSKVMMFMTWGRENGDPQWGPISTFEGMNTRLRNAYLRMADSAQASVCPVGSAWRIVRELDPSIQLYSDGSHPSVAGTYLAACTFYASIFQKSPVGAPFESSLTPAVASILQNAANSTVFDSLDTWKIAPMSEFTTADFSFTNSDPSVQFINESDHATNFLWSFGEGSTSTDENPTFEYSASGNYSVELIANSPCDSDTVSYEVNISNVTGLNAIKNGSFVLKNDQNGIFKIVSDMKITSGDVLSLDGKRMSVIMINNTFDLTQLSSGLYVIQIQTEKGNFSFKVRR